MMRPSPLPCRPDPELPATLVVYGRTKRKREALGNVDSSEDAALSGQRLEALIADAGASCSPL
jgi:hypothetical protein